MAGASEHGRIIAAAATAALEPLGCVRRGQSRIWQDDRRYWAINVEFQPSGWSKGSYLNVHVTWLWAAVTRGYQFSYRAGSFIPFETAEQFAPLMADMAATAAAEVKKVRERFKSYPAILAHIRASAARRPDFWNDYDAGVASALAGDIADAQQYFAQIDAWDTEGWPWRIPAKENASRLKALLGSPQSFQNAILADIALRRQFMRLPPDAHCLDELGSIVKP